MKKLVLFVLAVAIAFGATGCGAKNTTNNEKGNVELLWYVNSDPLNDLPKVLEKANEKTSEKLGITFNMKFIDDGAFTERLRMYMATGEEFDLCYAGYVNPYLTAVKNGGIIELDELIDKHAPDIKKLIPDYAFDAIRVDGKIYTIPNLQGMATVPTYFLRKELAEKYGLDKIDRVKNLEELEPYFDKMLADFPGIFPVNTAASDDIMYGYQTINDYAVVNKDDPEHKVLFRLELPVYEKTLQRARNWYKKGYIRPDIEIVTNANEDIKAKKYAGTFSSYGPGSKENYKGEFGLDTHLIQYCEGFMSVPQIQAAMTAVSATSEHPEEAVKLLNYVFTDKDMHNLLQYGIEDVHYKKIDDKYIELIARDEYYLAPFKFGNSFNSYLLEGEPENKVEETKKINDESEKAVFLGFNINTDPIKNEIAQCDAIKEEYRKSLNSGTVDYKVVLPEYISRLKSAGVDRILSEIQTQLDEWWAKNK